MISIVIPNYNGAKLLERNLPKLLALLEKSKLDFEIILADDASTDESAEVFHRIQNRQQEGVFKATVNEKNMGFASTVDRGIRAAKGEIVFTLKTDAVPESVEYFRIMMEHFKDSKVFAVSAALETTENGKKEIRGCGEIYFEKGFFLHRRGPFDFAQGTPTSKERYYSAWADGGGSAFRKDLYVKIGGFDSLYNPFYWEDTDLGYRAWKAGYRIDFEPQAVLLHDYESGAISNHYTKKQVEVISLRNQFIFVWKNGDLKHLGLYALWETFHAVVAAKNNDMQFFRAYWRAMLLWPRIIAARCQQKKVAKLTDDEALLLLSGN